MRYRLFDTEGRDGAAAALGVDEEGCVLPVGTGGAGDVATLEGDGVAVRVALDVGVGVR